MFQDNIGSRRQQSCLSKVFFKIDMAVYGNSLVRPMPHFYHQIAQTRSGVSYMMESGDIGRLVEYIKQNLDPGAFFLFFYLTHIHLTVHLRLPTP